MTTATTASCECTGDVTVPGIVRDVVRIEASGSEARFRVAGSDAMVVSASGLRLTNDLQVARQHSMRGVKADTKSGELVTCTGLAANVALLRGIGTLFPTDEASRRSSMFHLEFLHTPVVLRLRGMLLMGDSLVSSRAADGQLNFKPEKRAVINQLVSDAGATHAVVSVHGPGGTVTSRVARILSMSDSMMKFDVQGATLAPQVLVPLVDVFSQEAKRAPSGAPTRLLFSTNISGYLFAFYTTATALGGVDYVMHTLGGTTRYASLVMIGAQQVIVQRLEADTGTPPATGVVSTTVRLAPYSPPAPTAQSATYEFEGREVYLTYDSLATLKVFTFKLVDFYGKRAAIPKCIFRRVVPTTTGLLVETDYTCPPGYVMTPSKVDLWDFRGDSVMLHDITTKQCDVYLRSDMTLAVSNITDTSTSYTYEALLKNEQYAVNVPTRAVYYCSNLPIVYGLRPIWYGTGTPKLRIVDNIPGVPQVHTPVETSVRFYEGRRTEGVFVKDGKLVIPHGFRDFRLTHDDVDGRIRVKIIAEDCSEVIDYEQREPIFFKTLGIWVKADPVSMYEYTGEYTYKQEGKYKRTYTPVLEPIQCASLNEAAALFFDGAHDISNVNDGVLGYLITRLLQLKWKANTPTAIIKYKETDKVPNSKKQTVEEFLSNGYTHEIPKSQPAYNATWYQNENFKEPTLDTSHLFEYVYRPFGISAVRFFTRDNAYGGMERNEQWFQVAFYVDGRVTYFHKFTGHEEIGVMGNGNEDIDFWTILYVGPTEPDPPGGQFPV